MNRSSRSGTTLYEWLIAAVLVSILILMLIPLIQQSRDGHRRSHCKNNLKQIMLALHHYHDVYGSFPPAYVAGEDGMPRHSWRVLILPYIDQAYLHQQYDFSEPWNGPNNSKLASKHPTLDVFLCPESPRQNFHYMAIVGESSMWPGANSVSIKDVTDGISNKISVVEVTGHTSHWMEPADLKIDDLPLQVNPQNGLGISSHHKGGVNMGFADGSVRFMPMDFPDKDLQHLLLRNDGYPIIN